MGIYPKKFANPPSVGKAAEGMALFAITGTFPSDSCRQIGKPTTNAWTLAITAGFGFAVGPFRST